jgi:uncharacterized protein (DUF1778 family)
MDAVVHSKSERIYVRASTPVKQLLQEAARVAHKNVSEFLLDAGILAANLTLADRTQLAFNQGEFAQEHIIKLYKNKLKQWAADFAH